SQSRKGGPGDKSPLLRSEGDSSLDTQAIIRDLDDDEGRDDDSINALVAAGLIALGAAGALVYQRFVEPKVREYVASRRARKEAAFATESVEIVAISTQTTEIAKAVGHEIEESGVTIDGAQWYALFFDAIAHGAAGSAHAAISAEKWQMLANARVPDDGEMQALARAMQELTPDEFNARVDLVIEQHPELLDEDPSTVIGKLRGEAGDALLMPLSDSSGHGQPRTLAVEDWRRTFDNKGL
ncbi:MAG: hypothetical protein J0H64_10655, partial [Actinobacteria bacterium]|nr:hypothetical protein [Actinomycetota bacterium]